MRQPRLSRSAEPFGAAEIAAKPPRLIQRDADHRTGRDPEFEQRLGGHCGPMPQCLVKLGDSQSFQPCELELTNPHDLVFQTARRLAGQFTAHVNPGLEQLKHLHPILRRG